MTDGGITGTLKHVSTGSLAETWGPGQFLALAFSNKDADATSVKVGMEPTSAEDISSALCQPIFLRSRPARRSRTGFLFTRN